MPNRYWIAFVTGIIPGVCNWAVARSTGFHTDEYTVGMTAIGSEGYIITAVCWCPLMMKLIDREFNGAGIWSCICVVLSGIGMMHGSKVALPPDEIAWKFAISCVLCAVFFFGLGFGQKLGKIPRGPVEEIQGGHVTETNKEDLC